MKNSVQGLPSLPGVYQYYDAQGKLLYVGKAKNLKNRVKSYWRFTPEFMPNKELNQRIVKMLEEAKKIEYLIVESEDDALILENSLIKQLKPKYNILLRDDKTYPYIYIDETEEFPRFEITRKIINKKNITYYGPFPSGGKALLDSLYEVFPLVQKKSCIKGGKACLFYQIEKCLAPCEDKISSQAYKEIVQHAKDAISKRSILTVALEKRMSFLALNERYEEAAKIRDNIHTISSLSISSSLDLANQENLDIFAIQNGDEKGVIVRFFMRNGKIISSSHTFFRHTHIFDTNEAYKQTLLAFYSTDMPNISHRIIVAHSFEDSKQVALTLSKRFDKKIEIISPKIGPKYRLADLALQNCNELLRKKESDSIMEQRIADLLDLSAIPYRVETFDNSHMMGVAIVGGMVVWNEGAWDKSGYKRYMLKSKDEYGQMKEMLTRRIESFKTDPAPDLWILDGGKANLNLAIQLLKISNINLDVIAIAKEKLDAKAHRAKGAAKDIIHTHLGIMELKVNDPRLHWIQRQRDEAHRFAVAYHQSKKRKDDKQISLLNKKGVGKATVKKLLNYFGTFQAIEEASLQELEKVTNNSIAKALKNKK